MQRYAVHALDALALVVSAAHETCADTTGTDGVCVNTPCVGLLQRPCWWGFEGRRPSKNDLCGVVRGIASRALPTLQPP